MRAVYFDCYSGIAGDMTIGAFLDAGLKLKTLSKELGKLKLGGYELKAAKVKRGALSGTKFDVIVKDTGHNHRPFKDVISLIENSSINKRAKELAGRIFSGIGKAEAKVHGIKSESELHLHEVGDIDSIIDIVGTAVAMDELGIEEAYSSKVTLGRTVADTKGGVIPIPGPAALELLKGVPVKMTELEGELVTPTGAAILKALSKSFGEAPEMRIESIGYGAGTYEFKNMPNMLRIAIGEI